MNISYGGANEISRHLARQKHINNEETEKNVIARSDKLTSVFTRKDFSTINAKVKFTDFLVEQNVPLAVSGHAGPLFCSLFPDSKITKEYSCARTKSTLWRKTRLNIGQV